MKTKTFLLSILMLGFFAINVQAQKLKIPTVPKVPEQLQMQIPGKDFSKDLLKALDPGTGLGISPDKLLKLNKGNGNFVNNIMGILGGSGSDSDKLNLINKEKDERKDFIEKLLGKGKAGEYYKLVKKQLQKLQTKYALAKLFM